MPYFMPDDHFMMHIMLIIPVTWRHNYDHNYTEQTTMLVSNYDHNYGEEIKRFLS